MCARARVRAFGAEGTSRLCHAGWVRGVTWGQRAGGGGDGGTGRRGDGETDARDNTFMVLLPLRDIREPDI